MDDQRKEPRTHLIYYLRVFEPGTNNLFGHVVDISPNGMLITSDKPMSQNSQYTLEIEDASSLDDEMTVDVQVECRWCQGDEESSLYDAGFRLIDPSYRIHNMFEAYQ